MSEGGTVEETLIRDIGRLNTELAPGELGPVGAVVAAARQLPALPLADMFGLFLVPGVGAQGYTPQDVAQTFADCPERVMPSASRSLLAAGPDPARLRDAVASLAAQFVAR